MKQLLLAILCISLYFNTSAQESRGLLLDGGLGITSKKEFNTDIQLGFQKPFSKMFVTVPISVFSGKSIDSSIHVLLGLRFNYTVFRVTAFSSDLFDLTPFASFRREWYGKNIGKWTPDIGVNLIKPIGTSSSAFQEGDIYLSPRIQFNTQTRFIVTLGMRGIL